MALFVGTSGWDYREWKGGFYPPSLPQARFLEHYGRTLTACEVNATFHRLHSREAVARWAAAVPKQFRFAVKAHRRLTHRKAIGADDSAFMREFFSSLEPLGDFLACLLLQFPPYVERDDDGLARLLRALPAGMRFACEFRHESWAASDVETALTQAGGTVCLSETEGLVPESLASGSLAYVRLRGDHYTDEARSGWLELLERESRKRDVYAFGKHKDVPAGDPHAGVGLAQWLVEHSSQARIGSGG